MSKTMLKLMAAAIGGLSLFAASAANADSIAVTAPVVTSGNVVPALGPVWQVDGIQAVESEGYPVGGPWTSIDPAKWISTTKDSYAAPGFHDFATTVTLPVPDGYTISGIGLTGDFASDNALTGVSVNGQDITDAVRVTFALGSDLTLDQAFRLSNTNSSQGAAEYMYKINFLVEGLQLKSGDPNSVDLKFTVFNEATGQWPYDGPSSGLNNPLGFIFSGKLAGDALGQAVPVPASVWGGLTLFGLLGVAKLQNSRKQQM